MCRSGAWLVVWSLHQSAGLTACGFTDMPGLSLLVEENGVHHLVNEAVVVVPLKPARDIGASASDINRYLSIQ